MKSFFSQFERKKIVLAYAAVAFLAVSLFGLGFMYSMPNEVMAPSLGGKLDCPFSAGISICDMTPISHVDAWQSVFVSLLPLSSLVSLLFVIGAIIFFSLKRKKYKKYSASPPDSQKIKIISHGLFLREKGDMFRNPLLELFSSGILNTKIYA